MSCATKAVVSMAGNSVCCPASISAAKISSFHSFLAIPQKPLMLNLSCSLSYSFSPLSVCVSSAKNAKLKISVSVIAAQHEEDDTVVLEQEGELDSESGNSTEGEAGVGEEEYVEPPEEAKLFVGNLPYDVDSEKLAQLFGQAGVVEISEVIYNRETDQSRGFGFVTMSTVEEAEKAVEIFHSYSLNGRLLAVNKAAPRGSRVERAPRAFEPSYRIYAGNLPWDVDDGRLEQIFSEHGKVVNARVVYDRDSGRSRGFGFVTMSNESEMNDAIANLDGQSLDGRSIRVNQAEERPRRTF